MQARPGTLRPDAPLTPHPNRRPQLPDDVAAAQPPAAAPPPLSPVSQLFLGLGECAPDIYAILRVAGRPSLDDLAPEMQQLCDAHDRFRMKVVKNAAGVWCTEVRRAGSAVLCLACVWGAAGG